MNGLKEIVKKAKFCDRRYSGEPIYIAMPDPKNHDTKSDWLKLYELAK